MCRLAAYLGPPRSPTEIVLDAPHALRVQSHRPRQMVSGTVNADGWGVAWYPRIGSAGDPPARPVRVGDHRPIWQAEEELRPLLACLSVPCFLASVRDATPGIPIATGGQPMCRGRHVLTFNGRIESFRTVVMRRLHAELPDELYADLRGTTDTEALFLLALARIAAGSSPADALREVVDRVAGLAPGALALTMVVADGRGLAAVRYARGTQANSLHLAEAPAVAPDGVCIASEPVTQDPAWRELPDGSVIEIDPGGIRIADL